MARALVICLVMALLVAPMLVSARKHAAGGHHKKGGHHKHKGNDTSSGITSSKGVIAQRKGCRSSNLGYKASVDLNGKGLLFHWTITGSSLDAAIQSKSGAGLGYISVGFGKSTKMCPSDAIVGTKTGSVKAYKLTGYYTNTASSYKLSKTSSKVVSGSLVTKFVVNTVPKGGLIWAFSKSSSFVEHGKTDRGYKAIDFTCGA